MPMPPTHANCHGLTVKNEIDPSTVPAISKANLAVTAGEYYDRWTILAIKQEKCAAQPPRLAQVRKELWLLYSASPELYAARQDDKPTTLLVDQLNAVNRELWEVEDELRRCDSLVFVAGEPQLVDAAKTFMTLSRRVYQLNTERHRLKNALSQRYGHLGEIKEYATYGQS